MTQWICYIRSTSIMCQSVVIIAVLFLTQSRAELTIEISPESTEEQHGETYNNYYAPSTLLFQDIYSGNIVKPTEATPTGSSVSSNDVIPTTIEDVVPARAIKDEFHLDNMPTHFVEFRPKTEPVTTPGPIFLLNSSFLKKNDTVESTSTSTTTEEPEDSSISVLPIKKSNYQRGVLDLLFPAVRVKSFKSVFDMFRRLLSHTF